jgi:ferredoxin
VYDEQRRFAPEFEEGNLQALDCDTVLIAAGQAPDLSFLEQGGGDVEQFRPGWPKVDATTLMTTAKGVFVAGDLAHGTRLLIDAVASGKQAARSVYQHVTGRTLHPETLMSFVRLDRYQRERGFERIPRVELQALKPEERLRDPKALVEKCLGKEAAVREASRCLDCGVTPVFDGNRCILCYGCVDVCPTLCLKIVPLSSLNQAADLAELVKSQLGESADLANNSAILKDEDRCIRCALCVERCPADAIAMERVSFRTEWRTT